MLSRITSPLRAMRVLTWDLEWDPKTLQLTVAGLYDGDEPKGRRYRSFLNIESFLRHILTRRYRGAYFFAHYGGRFDVVFLLRELKRLSENFRVQFMFAGSSAMVVRISDGNSSWTLCDSQFTFKESLATMARSIG